MKGIPKLLCFFGGTLAIAFSEFPRFAEDYVSPRRTYAGDVLVEYAEFEIQLTEAPSEE